MSPLLLPLDPQEAQETCPWSAQGGAGPRAVLTARELSKRSKTKWEPREGVREGSDGEAPPFVSSKVLLHQGVAWKGAQSCCVAPMALN